MLLRIVIGYLLVPFFISCSNYEHKAEASQNIETVNNPNKDSELTLLMREIYETADSIKQHIKSGSGTITKTFIAELEQVHTAMPSDPKLSNPTFTAFNNLIITEAESLQSRTENRIDGFNKLVNRCLDCHKTFCPGPIPRIKKLKI